MAASSITPLSELQNKYLARTKLLQSVLDHVAGDPEFGDELAQALVEAGCQTTGDSVSHAAQGTHADQVIAYFRKLNNPWLEVAQIRKGTGIGRGAIANVLYKTHVDMFEHKDHPSHKARQIWRLTPDKEQQHLLVPIVGVEVSDD